MRNFKMLLGDTDYAELQTRSFCSLLCGLFFFLEKPELRILLMNQITIGV
jgi:hypothetical protein